MYVAITRAKEKLYISRAYERYNFGTYSANPKSRFLKEIPEDFLDFPKKESSSASIFSQSASSSFANFGKIFAHPEKSSSITKTTNASDFSVGMRVRHNAYGKGTIVGINGDIADIAFAGMGIKKMNVTLAPIKKIEEK